jgi:hypothetical protein
MFLVRPGALMSEALNDISMIIHGFSSAFKARQPLVPELTKPVP